MLHRPPKEEKMFLNAPLWTATHLHYSISAKSVSGFTKSLKKKERYKQVLFQYKKVNVGTPHVITAACKDDSNLQLTHCLAK